MAKLKSPKGLRQYDSRVHGSLLDIDYYLVDIGKGKRAAYTSRVQFRSEFANNAYLHYRAINIGNGFKKRLVAVTTAGNWYVIQQEQS